MAASVSTKSAGVLLQLQPPLTSSSLSASSTGSKVKKVSVDIQKAEESNRLSNGVGNNKNVNTFEFSKVEVVAFDPTIDYEKLIREEKLKEAVNVQKKKVPAKKETKPPLSQTFQGSKVVQQLVKSCEEYANKILADSLLKNKPLQNHPTKSMKFTLSSSIHKPSTSVPVTFRVPRSACCTKIKHKPPPTSPLIDESCDQSVETEQLSPLTMSNSISVPSLQKSPQPTQNITKTQTSQPVSASVSSTTTVVRRPTLVFVSLSDCKLNSCGGSAVHR